MPSFSRASSMIGRFLAAWAISISDFGWACWDEAMDVLIGERGEGVGLGPDERQWVKLSTERAAVSARLPLPLGEGWGEGLQSIDGVPLTPTLSAALPPPEGRGSERAARTVAYS